ncbi:hypothetical protein ACH4YN_39575 [Streptomyces griseofuscus]|uniref:hypothetical protein n=1 Tax=Streptomyces griseofuscus TaxID=146922 RepID=UPI0037AD4CE9
MQQRDVLGWLAMGASVVVAAQGEWSLAVACHFGVWVAAALPVAIDAYAIRAMQTGREVLPAVLLMIATNAASHLHRGGVLPVSPWLVVAVSAIAPVVLWRVHALRRRTPHGTPAVPQGNTPAVEPVPTASPAPAIEPAPTPVSPAAVPQGNTIGTEGDTEPSPSDPEVSPTPDTESAPVPASPLVICGGHLGVPDVPPRPRLDADVARAAIERAWREGLSIRAAAKRATRSTTQVQRVYAELDATRPIEGQTAIDTTAADAA